MSSEGRSRWFSRCLFAAFFIAVGMALSCCIFMFWVKNYPNSDDPKNIDYVLWKHGLNKNMNIDAALDAMTHDPDRLKLVYGLSKEQLRERFGELRESNPSISCKAPQGEEAVYLKHNLWVVVLKDGKAIDLILCKG